MKRSKCVSEEMLRKKVMWIVKLEGSFSTEEDDLDYELDRTSESEFELM